MDKHENKKGLKTFKSYAIGLLLSLLLTVLSFALVAIHLQKGASEAYTMSNTGLILSVMALALVQLFIQVVCFLRLNNSREGRWELMPFLFTILIVLVLLFGSLWIMFNLNYNMMN
jgi:cytochrome o ubiquinol oxidase operon protein cyoD